MRVQDLMTSNVKACTADTDLATAATMMWDYDCGIVPIVNTERKVVGVITDRDIAIAAATRALNPSSIRVGDVITGRVYACAPDDDSVAALRTMRDQRIRRLPVLDRQQRLVGILSMNDLVARAETRKGADVPGEEVLETLKSICAHQQTLTV